MHSKMHRLRLLLVKFCLTVAFLQIWGNVDAPL